MNPTENDAKEASVPVTGSKDGKKTLLKIRAAAVPKMKKSYHSIVVPMRLAKATLRDERRDGPPRVGSDSEVCLVPLTDIGLGSL